MKNYNESPARANRLQGTVYLIHLDSKLHHAQHYIGWAANVEGRLYHHRKGRGARFLAAVNQAGISYDVVREWPGDKNLERQLKNRKNAPMLCPVCQKVHQILTYEKAFNNEMVLKAA